MFKRTSGTPIILAILFLAIFFFGCPHNPPSPPAPGAFCGDHACNGTETPTTCPADCEAPDPDPDPEPLPEPEPVYQAHAKAGDRVATIGIYGAFSSPSTDPEKIAAAIYDSKFSGAVTNLMGVRPQDPKKPVYPWVWNGTRFLLDKDNPEYYARLGKWLHAFARRGIDWFGCFDDPFFESKWNIPGPHPYRQNDKGINYGDSAKKIYDSIGFAPTRYYWLKWAIISEPSLKFSFSPGDAIGVARMRWIGRVMDMVAAEKKLFPGWRVGWKRALEERGTIDPAIGKTTFARSLGDRSEAYVWFYEQWKKRGLTPGPTFFCFINRQVTGGTDAQKYAAMAVMHKAIVGKYGQSFGLGAIQEIHIDSVSDIQSYFDNSGLSPPKTFISTDGIPKDCGTFISAQRALYYKNYPYMDFIFEEALCGNVPAPLQQYQKNFDKMFPKHKEIVR